MSFIVGRLKTGGRQMGTPNRVTGTVRMLLEDAFESMGGLDALVKWGQENPTEFYKLWAKMLPVGLNLRDDYDETQTVTLCIETA
jgi:hypothetical protein